MHELTSTFTVLPRSCISLALPSLTPLSDSISQRASLFTYHLVCPGYSPAPSQRNTPISSRNPVSSQNNSASSGSESEHRNQHLRRVSHRPDPAHVEPSMPSTRNTGEVGATSHLKGGLCYDMVFIPTYFLSFLLLLSCDLLIT
jgi:hypothetical protein